MLEKDGYIAWQNYERAWGNPIPNYSTDGGIAVLIIERENIGIWPPDQEHPYWTAGKEGVMQAITGPTLLIAGLRCYITSKLGDTVEVPDDLT